MVTSNYKFFQYCDSNYEHFLIAPCKFIALNLLCFIYGISSLLIFLIALCMVIALKGDSRKITVTFCFKSLKERQRNEEQYRKEAINQSAKPIQKIKQRC